MIRVNLAPPELLDKEIAQQRTVQVGIAAGAVAVLIAGVSLFHHKSAVKWEKLLQADEAEFDRLQKIVAQVEELEQKAKHMRTQLATISDLRKSRAVYPRFMEDLLKLLPPGVWLTNLSTVSDPAGTVLSVSISCKSGTSEDVAVFLRTLETSDRFKDGQLSGGITVNVLPTAVENVFNMTMKYSPPPLEEPKT
jgi:type IV pilus assembly protein PilN